MASSLRDFARPAGLPEPQSDSSVGTLAGYLTECTDDWSSRQQASSCRLGKAGRGSLRATVFPYEFVPVSETRPTNSGRLHYNRCITDRVAASGVGG
jgi:hypothetical protein